MKISLCRCPREWRVCVSKDMSGLPLNTGHDALDHVVMGYMDDSKRSASGVDAKSTLHFTRLVSWRVHVRLSEEYRALGTRAFVVGLYTKHHRASEFQYAAQTDVVMGVDEIAFGQEVGIVYDSQEPHSEVRFCVFDSSDETVLQPDQLVASSVSALVAGVVGDASSSSIGEGYTASYALLGDAVEGAEEGDEGVVVGEIMAQVNIGAKSMTSTTTVNHFVSSSSSSSKHSERKGSTLPRPRPRDATQQQHFKVLSKEQRLRTEAEAAQARVSSYVTKSIPSTSNKITLHAQAILRQCGASFGVKCVDHVGGDDTQDGALVVHVHPNSPASAAGLDEDDIIREVNGVRVVDVASLVDAMKGLEVCEKYQILVKQYTGQDATPMDIVTSAKGMTFPEALNLARLAKGLASAQEVKDAQHEFEVLQQEEARVEREREAQWRGEQERLAKLASQPDSRQIA
jgi:hypothetical protein